jgi:hypothetical protein
VSDRALDELDKDLRAVFWDQPGTKDHKVAACDRERAHRAAQRDDGYEPNPEVVAEGWGALFGETP